MRVANKYLIKGEKSRAHEVALQYNLQNERTFEIETDMESKLPKII